VEVEIMEDMHHMSRLLIATQVIHNTFLQSLKPGQDFPTALADELYQSFATRQPYSLYPDVKEFFVELHKYRNTGTICTIPWRFERIIVGIITNSDDRVPGILQSFDLQVGSRRAGTTSHITKQNSPQNDIDFVVLSYDVGHEKPDPRIFNAATSVLTKMLTVDEEGLDVNDFEKLYVGDDLEKDYLGAMAAGWHSVLLDHEGVMDMADGFRFGTVGVKDKEGMEQKVAMARSLLHLGMWEPRFPAETRNSRNSGPK
jgi:FMN phosphatase YigB (HAD superfamily)